MKPLALVLTLVMCGPAWADDVSDLIKKLDAETFRQREEAAGKLEALGKEAIPSLAEAAGAGNLETGIRSIDILKKLAEGNDKETAAEARSALEKLAKSENAATARRAKNALDPPRPEPVPGVPNRLPFGRILPARVLPPRIAANVRRVTTRTVNGVKTIEVEEGDRKVKIEEDPDKGIRVEITEKQNGKDVTEKFEAKNEADLKKNHPKAHAEYEKYAGANANAIRVQFPAAGQPFRPRVPANPQLNEARLQAAGRLLETLGRHLETITRDETFKDASKESREALKKEIAEMKNRLGELEKKLESAGEEETKEKPAPALPAEERKPENAPPAQNTPAKS